ncbi:TIGR04283 family arsenosugar biosynthesis glycosyltransferase [Halochromatium salexigens]|uniref:Glycosyltransferase 2-like domain-containing protein n=1 Tax=Halochromatium salexigens TaxID=49447 RepID=A0AAJ0XHY4_HALSE|nr:glycosyltransferase family 2 protein [Halochromatium salexigens]MBK5932266.1 hypothetical protein [Halochromatium salexigens]
MKLSIIISTLNEAETIGALLADLARLRIEGAKLILVDGGSRDATLARAAVGVDQILHAPRGRAAQMNAGAQAATGDLFWFLHADTRVPEDAIAALQRAAAQAVSGLYEADGDVLMPMRLTQLRRAEAHRARTKELKQPKLPRKTAEQPRDAGAWAGFWGRFDVQLSGRHPLLRLVERGMNTRSRLTGIATATGDQGLFVSRAAFERVGSFPPLALMEDLALSAALRRLARPVCLRARLLASSRRWEQGGVLRTILLMWRLRLAYALGANPHRLAARSHGQEKTHPSGPDGPSTMT